MRSKPLAREIAICALLPMLVVGAFSSKAFHIDDPAYLWTARQILESPLDFYGFKVNWGSADVMMFEANRNPPGVSYFIAIGAWLFGWSEVALHLWMGLFASLLGVSTYLVARKLCSTPLLATLAVLTMPAVVVSSTTVMTDVPMLALFTLSVYLWIEGIERDRAAWLISGGACAGLAFLMKYFGITLVPLLLVYGVIRTRKLGGWCAYLLIPIAIAAGYLAWVHRLYGLNPLTEAAAYAQHAGTGDFAYIHARPLIGLVFAGGTLATVGFYGPLLWRGRIAAGVAAFGLAPFVLAAMFGDFFFYKAAGTWPQELNFALHYAVFASVGASILLLVLVDLKTHRDADSALLCLWLLGTFAFSAFVNWSVTARTILPMSVPAGILLVRRLDRGSEDGVSRARGMRWLPLAPAALLSLWVAYGDYASAEFARRAARHVAAHAEAYPGRYWFMGHWGFQYYLEETGMRFLTPEAVANVSAGDRVAVFRWLTFAPPSFNSANVTPVLGATFHEANPAFVSTHDPLTRSGFYSSVLGPLPYTFGPASDVWVDEFEFRPGRSR